MVMVVTPVMVARSGMSGYSRPNQNHESDNCEHSIAKHFHSDKPLGTQPPKRSSGPGDACSIHRLHDRKSQFFLPDPTMFPV
jgi:hypothetical protein